MIPLYLIASLTVLLLTFLFSVEVRKRRLRSMSWEDLLNGLAPIEAGWLVLVGIESGASGYEDNGLSRDLWESFGGWQGIHGLLRNAERLRALAFYASTWDERRTAQLAEEIRAEARRLELAALNAMWKRGLQIGSLSADGDLQRAARAYFLLTEHLLDLYGGRPSQGIVRLRDAIRPYLATSNDYPWSYVDVGSRRL